MTLLSSVRRCQWSAVRYLLYPRRTEQPEARQSLTLEELYQMFRDGADAVISRGKAERR